MNDGQRNTNKMLIGACGIFCRACDYYFANTEEGTHLLTGLAHHREAEKALEKNKGSTLEQWYALSEKRWTCPSCGHQYSYYEQRCVQCNALLNVHDCQRIQQSVGAGSR